jgi:hypothetical protein
VCLPPTATVGERAGEAHGGAEPPRSRLAPGRERDGALETVERTVLVAAQSQQFAFEAQQLRLVHASELALASPESFRRDGESLVDGTERELRLRGVREEVADRRRRVRHAEQIDALRDLREPVRRRAFERRRESAAAERERIQPEESPLLADGDRALRVLAGTREIAPEVRAQHGEDPHERRRLRIERGGRGVEGRRRGGLRCAVHGEVPRGVQRDVDAGVPSLRRRPRLVGVPAVHR